VSAHLVCLVPLVGDDRLDLDAQERMAVQFLDLLSADHHAIDADFYRALGNVFTTAQIVELGFACTEMMGVYLLDHEDAPYDVALVFEKLKYAEWTAWPEPAIEAIRVFVEAWVQALADRQHESRDEPWHLDELQSALAESGYDITTGRLVSQLPVD
jgi:hypothetical protein